MKKRVSVTALLKQYMMLLVLVVIVLLGYLLTNGVLLKPMNVSNLINQNAYIVILAVGMLICILTGGNIDLAVGSVVALIGACAGTFIITWGWNTYLSVLLCLVIGIGIGIWQGFWIAYVRIPAFIVTLSGQLVFRGLTLMILKGLTISPFPSDYMGLTTGFIGSEASRETICLVMGFVLAAAYIILQVRNRIVRKRKGYDLESIVMMLVRCVVIAAALIWLFWMLSNYRGIPTVFVTLAIVLLVYSFITSKTVMGRHIYAIGGNEKAARLSGVNTNKMLFLAYVNMSLLAAVAGIAFSARLNGASPQAGQSFELDAIASSYIGGVAVSGGVGKVTNTIVGALVIMSLTNGMNLLGVDVSFQYIVKGAIFILAVAFDVISRKK